MTESVNVKEIILPNGLRLVYHDDSRRYFGDYHLVRVVASVTVPLDPVSFGSEEGFKAAAGLLPSPLVYRRVIEKMGVPGADVDRERDAMIDDFLRHAGRYLGSPEFPATFIRRELSKSRSIRGRAGGAAAAPGA